jgi:hypothetical protein
VIEIAVAYLGAYLGRKALGLVGRAAGDVDEAVDAKLGELYDWVKARLTGRPSGEVSLTMLEEAPEGEKQQALVTDQIGQAIAGDEDSTRELQALIEELERLRPVAEIWNVTRAERATIRDSEVGVVDTDAASVHNETDVTDADISGSRVGGVGPGRPKRS